MQHTTIFIALRICLRNKKMGNNCRKKIGLFQNTKQRKFEDTFLYPSSPLHFLRELVCHALEKGGKKQQKTSHIIEHLGCYFVLVCVNSK